ncbi:hypothetical protein Sste5346_007542 [Sporothrix stenoceras]|uniref:Uncharacterized protein n=1 Tax=Sporothrix stenoceras TaxID=5173 RepID=A0ABR3YUR3_9PEZI
MPIAVGRLVALALGYFGPLHNPTHARENNTARTDGLSKGFLEGFTPQPALDGRPPQQQLLLVMWYLLLKPNQRQQQVVLSSRWHMLRQLMLWQWPDLQQRTMLSPCKVLESSVIKSIVEVTNTNAETQTNWVYVTTTSIGKRAEPTDFPLGDTTDAVSSTNINGLGVPNASRDHSNIGAISEIASAAPIEATTSTLRLPIKSTDPAGPFNPPIPIPSAEPLVSTEAVVTQAVTTAAVATEPVLPRQALTDADTMAATHSTSTVIHAVTVTSVVTSVIASTTTMVTTSTGIQTVYQTNTVVLNAKTTVEATSTWTYTSHRPVTVTLTETAAAHNTGSASSSAATPALVTSVSDAVTPKKNLSSGAIAGIAVGATVFAIVFCLAVFYISRRHIARAKERKEASEDYAFLGTGRSDFDGPARSNSGSSKGPQMILLNRHYSGPPPPNARRPSVRSPVTSDTDPAQNERGLPPIPWYSAASKTSPPTSPVSPTSGSLPFSNDPMSPTSPTSPTFPAYGRAAAHMRSGSAQTAGTATSSTIVGDNSNRNSVRSNSGKTVRFSNGGLPHQRAPSSGSGNETVNEPLDNAPNPEESLANIPAVQVTPAAPPPALVPPIVQHAPAELHSVPAPRADPPSPMLQPQLGRLRIVNGSADADDTSDQDEPMPKPQPRTR